MLSYSSLWELSMQDLIYVAITVLFFALSLAYVRFCDRIRWEAGHANTVSGDDRNLRANDDLSVLRVVTTGEVL